jgi:hypothetical protein
MTNGFTGMLIDLNLAKVVGSGRLGRDIRQAVWSLWLSKFYSASLTFTGTTLSHFSTYFCGSALVAHRKGDFCASLLTDPGKAD